MDTTTAVAWIYLEEADETVEGHFYTPDHARMTYHPPSTPVACPFCATPLVIVSAPYLGRIILERDGTRTRQAMRTLAVVDLVPSSLETLSCPTCEMAMTRPKDQTS